MSRCNTPGRPYVQQVYATQQRLRLVDIYPPFAEVGFFTWFTSFGRPASTIPGNLERL